MAPAGRAGGEVRLAQTRGRALRVRGASGRRTHEVLRRQPRGQLLLAAEAPGGRDRGEARAQRLQHGAPAPLRVRRRHHHGDGRPDGHGAQPEADGPDGLSRGEVHTDGHLRDDRPLLLPHRVARGPRRDVEGARTHGADDARLSRNEGAHPPLRRGIRELRTRGTSSTT